MLSALLVESMLAVYALLMKYSLHLCENFKTHYRGRRDFGTFDYLSI